MGVVPRAGRAGAALHRQGRRGPSRDDLAEEEGSVRARRPARRDPHRARRLPRARDRNRESHPRPCRRERPGTGRDPRRPITDPGWTPLFTSAEAVVVNVGSTLSHAAIVSRELGIPCVLGVPHATKRIQDGAKLTVDGTTGLVTVH
ncbi:MAG: PEP-utilizing enzyme [Mycobacteriales bacterium]